MKEIWRIVPSFPFFMASNLGRVMVVPHTNGRGRRKYYGGEPHFGAWNKTDARFQVTRKNKTYRVAQLVCEAFNGPRPSSKHVCIHRDENSANNRAKNLKWGTQKENMNAPRFIEYCRSRIGKDSPRTKWAEARC